MHSMTGYGRMSVERDGRQLTIELKSVNHRFLDLSFRMPRSFNCLEDMARKMIGARLARGHVDVFATYRNMREDSKKVAVDEALLSAYMTALDQIREKAGLTDNRGLMQMAQMHDVLVVSEAEEDQEALKALMEEALTGALDQMQEMRAREGESLKADVLDRIGRLEKRRRRNEICL